MKVKITATLEIDVDPDDYGCAEAELLEILKEDDNNEARNILEANAFDPDTKIEVVAAG